MSVNLNWETNKEEPEQLQVYTVNAIYQREDSGDKIGMEMNILAMSIEECERVFNEYKFQLPKFNDGTYLLEDERVEILGIKLFDVNIFNGIKLDATVPLEIGEICLDNYGDWEDMVNLVVHGDEALPKFRKLHVYAYELRIDELIFYYDSRKINKSARNAIITCVRSGIDPFGA